MSSSSYELQGTPDEDAIAEIARVMARRQFLGLGLTAAAATLGSIDSYRITSRMLMEGHWPDSETTRTELHPELLPAFEGWLVVPGFGNQHGDHMAQRFDKLFGGLQPISYLNYANQGMSEHEIKALMHDYARNLQTLNIYGHSMGGPSALLAAQNLGKPLNHIVLDCSPFDIRDARDGSDITNAISWFAEVLGYKGGPVGTYGGNFYTQLRRKGWAESWKNFFPETLSAAKETWDGASPKLLLSQLKLLEEIDLMKHRERFKGIITPDTVVIFCAPEYFSHDKIVDDAQAYQKWQHFFAYFGVKMQLLLVEGGSHASAGRTIPQLRRPFNFDYGKQPLEQATGASVLTIQGSTKPTPAPRS